MRSFVLARCAAAESYLERAQRRVWRCTHFSWWITTMLHRDDDPFTRQLQLSQLRWVTSSEESAAGLAANYAGLPVALLAPRPVQQNRRLPR